jgi:predicted Zn-dependent protease
VQEQIQVDHAVSRGWATQLENKVEITHDIEVEVALRHLAEKLVALRPMLAGAPIGVLVYKNGDGRLPLGFSIPGNRIYLSREILKQLEFENEVVAALALECGHLTGRHAISETASSGVLDVGSLAGDSHRPVDFFSPAGVFSFTITQRLEAVREAARLLYESGYDPRGLVSYLRKLQTQRNGLESGTLVQLENAARNEMSRVPPLRNPLVRTEAFLKLQGRIRKL